MEDLPIQLIYFLYLIGWILSGFIALVFARYTSNPCKSDYGVIWLMGAASLFFYSLMLIIHVFTKLANFIFKD